MHVTVTGQHIEIGENIRSHVERSLTATVEKYFSNAIEATVVLSREAHLIRSDISVHVGRGILVHGHAEAVDATAACDSATEHIGKQLRRSKRRLRSHHNPKGER